MRLTPTISCYYSQSTSARQNGNIISSIPAVFNRTNNYYDNISGKFLRSSFTRVTALYCNIRVIVLKLLAEINSYVWYYFEINCVNVLKLEWLTELDISIINRDEWELLWSAVLAINSRLLLAFISFNLSRKYNIDPISFSISSCAPQDGLVENLFWDLDGKKNILDHGIFQSDWNIRHLNSKYQQKCRVWWQSVVRSIPDDTRMSKLLGVTEKWCGNERIVVMYVYCNWIDFVGQCRNCLEADCPLTGFLIGPSLIILSCLLRFIMFCNSFHSSKKSIFPTLSSGLIVPCPQSRVSWRTIMFYSHFQWQHNSIVFLEFVFLGDIRASKIRVEGILSDTSLVMMMAGGLESDSLAF